MHSSTYFAHPGELIFGPRCPSWQPFTSAITVACPRQCPRRQSIYSPCRPCRRFSLVLLFRRVWKRGNSYCYDVADAPLACLLPSLLPFFVPSLPPSPSFLPAFAFAFAFALLCFASLRFASLCFALLACFGTDYLCTPQRSVRLCAVL